MAELTVCIPAFDAADVIERAIRSVRSDEVPGGVEILVCDDGSGDDTAAVVTRVAAEVEGVRLIVNDTNRGRPATRNRLMSEATGRFMTWLDADDEKYPGMLAAQMARLNRIETEQGTAALEGLLVYTNFDWLRPGWTRPKLVEPPETDDPMEKLLDASFGGYLWLMMGLRDTFVAAGPFDERLPRLQDLGFFIRFAELGGRFTRVDTAAPLCVYHKSDDGRDSMAVWRSWNRIWRVHRHHFESYGMFNARRWRRKHFAVVRRFAKANDDATVFWAVTAREVVFVIHGRLRRVLFDA